MSWQEEYAAAVHAMQSAVAIMIAHELGMARHPGAPTPPFINPDKILSVLKHLRVGVNSAMSDQGALAKLLISKGVFTEEEYRTVILEFAKREAETNAAEARRKLNLPPTVTFG